MSHIRVSKPFSRPSHEVYRDLRDFMSRPESRPPIGNEKPEIQWNDEALRGSFSMGKIEGAFFVTGDLPCTLNIEIKIPLIMSPLKGLIEKTLQKHLETLH